MEITLVGSGPRVILPLGFMERDQEDIDADHHNSFQRGFLLHSAESDDSL